MITTDLRRRALRAAARIHEHLVGPAQLREPGPLPFAVWQEAQHTAWQLALACRRGWRTAGNSLLSDVDYQVRRVIRELEAYLQSLPTTLASGPVASPGDIGADLLALAAEFEEVEIDLKAKQIGVLTPPVVLNELELGPFRIHLAWSQIGCGRAYTVVAQEPNYPSGDDDTTHPHVRKNVLCEGDGASPIKRALSEGRLLDFFVLVRQILDTYNSASPYVSLDRWNGVECVDCGDRMDAEEHGSCDRCGEALCSACSGWCRSCDNYVCSGCSGHCSECGGRFCDACLEAPAAATLRLCPTCLEKLTDAKDAEENAGATADPLCLGETAAAA